VSPSYPPGSFNAHWFNFFNAISFQIMMGAPIILYAKSLGASSTVIGIVASFTPLLTVMQLPAARFLDRCGYREFVLGGWSLRTLFIFLVAGVPMLTFLEPASRMVLLVALLFFFNLLRGISSAAWLPWMAALIPAERRGRFLSLDQMFMVAGCLVSLGVSALVMGGSVEAWEYSLVFLVSAAGGALSLVFIKRIPEASSPEEVRRGSARVPWRAMLAYAPFARLLGFNLLFMAVLGSLGVFTVEFLGEKAGFAPSYVLLLSAFSFLGALAALPVCGALVDRTGSKPVMRLATGVVTAVIAGWFVLAAGVVPAAFWVVACMNLCAGAASATHNLANTRIIMATMPEMGRNHFFALFMVITSLGLGTAPVAWGLMLDLIGTFEAVTGPVIWRQHSFYFLALFAIGVLSCFGVSWLVEAPPGQKPEPNLIYAKLKRAPRIWQR
jgi:MFS family permease